VSPSLLYILSSFTHKNHSHILFLTSSLCQSPSCWLFCIFLFLFVWLYGFRKHNFIASFHTFIKDYTPYANNKEEQCITGYNWVTGTKEDQSSYRSEVAGVSGALAVLDVLVKHYHIESGSVTIALDGLSALQQCAGDWPLSIDQPCFDVLQDIRGRLKELPITVDFRWVEGHQHDKGMAYYNLDWWGLINYKMDLAAKQYMEDVTIHPGR
jgi:hypothetical protein